MRRIDIGHQAGEEFPFVAVDKSSGHIMFRHDDVWELEALCRKLRWEIVSVAPPPYRHALPATGLMLN
jgi:hypothetical protein